MRTYLFLMMLFALPAQAHKPFFSEGQHTTSDSAWRIEDPDISIVLYHEVTCEAGQVWLTFDSQPGAEIFFQLGVPVLDRLRDYGPSIALFAPGLPAINEDLPFSIPDGLGGLVYHARDIQGPTEFYEPFTQTESWIWIEETIAMVDSGTGYVVAWHPETRPGKLWVAVGTVENFSDETVEAFREWWPKTRDFHEIGTSTAESDGLGGQCADAPQPSAANDSGCAATTGSSRPSAPFGMMLIVFVACVVRRSPGVR